MCRCMVASKHVLFCYDVCGSHRAQPWCLLLLTQPFKYDYPVLLHTFISKHAGLPDCYMLAATGDDIGL